MRIQDLNNVCSTTHGHEIDPDPERLRKEIEQKMGTSIIFIVGKHQQAAMEKATQGWKSLTNKSGIIAKDCGPITKSARLWKIRRA